MVLCAWDIVEHNTQYQHSVLMRHAVVGDSHKVGDHKGEAQE